MIVCRSRPFVRYVQPLLAKHFGVGGPEWDVENVYGHLTRVQRGLIRVDADELTYPLHIMLRYELEKQLLTGELAVRDLPEAWNAGMEQRLGIRPQNDVEGCLQDIHWAVGSFGYFPSYALGARHRRAALREPAGGRAGARRAAGARGVRRAVRLAAHQRARPRRQGAGAGAAQERHRQAARRPPPSCATSKPSISRATASSAAA